MKQFAVLLFLLTAASGFSQEQPLRNSLSVYFSPDYAFAANTVQEVRGQACYSFGASYGLRAGERSNISIGVNLSSRRFRTNNITYSENFDSLSQTFDTTFYNVVDRTFLQIPVRWNRYIVENERFGLYISAGLSFNVQVRQKTHWTGEPRAGGENREYAVTDEINQRAFGVNPFIGAGFEFRLSESVSLALQPEYGFYFLKNYNYTMQTVGVAALLNFRF